MSDDPLQELANQFERLMPTDLITRINRDRPYDGQPWTESGTRGATRVESLTFRDVYDCFVIACYEASGLPYEDYPETIYALPWDEMDPNAIGQCLMVTMEKRMGIYPNVPSEAAQEFRAAASLDHEQPD